MIYKKTTTIELPPITAMTISKTKNFADIPPNSPYLSKIVMVCNRRFGVDHKISADVVTAIIPRS